MFQSETCFISDFVAEEKKTKVEVAGEREVSSDRGQVGSGFAEGRVVVGNELPDHVLSMFSCPSFLFGRLTCGVFLENSGFEVKVEEELGVSVGEGKFWEKLWESGKEKEFDRLFGFNPVQGEPVSGNAEMNDIIEGFKVSLIFQSFEECFGCL